MKVPQLVIVLICVLVAANSLLLSPKGLHKCLSLRGGKSKKVSSRAKNLKSRERGQKGIGKVRSSGKAVENVRLSQKSIWKEWMEKLLELLGGMIKKPQTSSSAKLKRREKRAKMTANHLEKSFAKGDANARIQKEMRAFLGNPPEGCKLAVGSNMRVWVITVTGAKNTIYAGEKYKLKMVFPKDYPAKPPSVFFLKPTPKHMHVYTNGDICLNLLGRDWRPTMTGQMLAISILSMLSNAKQKGIPQDNAMHADAAPGQAQDNWFYHDDTC